ncbi:MAG: hypothetical protein HQL21_07450 [Candidatus Omnitrophica bacterium]|nr:hypothetical protein [Candidatus Omnitrophota bacterium]
MGKNDLQKVRKFFLVGLVLVITGGSLTGCTSIRKKFIRKKKTADHAEDFIPVLQPVEYKRADQSSFEKYKEQYTMARAYFKDAEDTMGSVNAGSKQQVYALNQLIVRLQSMADLLPGEKKAELEQVVIGVRNIVKEYDKPAPLRRYDILKGAMRNVEKAVRADFKPDMVKGEFEAP